MQIFIAGQNGDLGLHPGKSIVVGFDDGKILELDEGLGHLPPVFPEGIHIWGGRVPSQTTANMKHSQLNITSVAGNGIIVAPCGEKPASPTGMTMFISDDNDHLHPVKDKKAVIELNNGKTLEVVEDYAKKGLLVWGGREPISELSREELKARTESLGIYPVSANVIHVFPFKPE
jgi:hypothetical protein